MKFAREEEAMLINMRSYMMCEVFIAFIHLPSGNTYPNSGDGNLNEWLI